MAHTTCRTAFTLVELLVVIGIIATLVAILLPTLNSARASARSVQCLSNQKQVFTSVLLYVSDNDSSLPYAWAPNNELVNRTLRLYLNQDEKRGSIAEASQCPAALIEETEPFFTTYGVNLGTFIFSPDYVVPPRPTEKISSVPRSTEIFAFGDVNQVKETGGNPNGGSHEFVYFTDLTNAAPDGFVYQPDEVSEIDASAPLPTVNNVDIVGRPGAFRYRHGSSVSETQGSANVVFHDGHAENLKIGQLTQQNVAVTY